MLKQIVALSISCVSLVATGCDEYDPLAGTPTPKPESQYEICRDSLVRNYENAASAANKKLNYEAMMEAIEQQCEPRFIPSKSTGAPAFTQGSGTR